MGYHTFSILEDPNTKVWMPIKLNIAEDTSSISFELNYDANNFLYSEYELGDLASYFTQFDVTVIGPGELKVEGEFTGGVISEPLKGDLLILKFEQKEDPLTFWGSSYQQFQFSTQNSSADFSSSFGKIIMNVGVTTMDLPNGWSMISLPRIPENTSVSSLFHEAKEVYGHEYIVLAHLRRARFISASLITLRSLHRFTMSVMSGSMDFGGLLLPKSYKNSWSVETLPMGLPESAVTTVVMSIFWRSLIRVGHFAQVAI